MNEDLIHDLMEVNGYIDPAEIPQKLELIYARFRSIEERLNAAFSEFEPAEDDDMQCAVSDMLCTLSNDMRNVRRELERVTDSLNRQRTEK